MAQTLTIPRLFARFGLPHADPARVTRGNGRGDLFTPSSGRWVRRDGEEWFMARSGDAGLPWGKWSRLALIVLATEARRKQHRTIRLPNISKVVQAIGGKVAGGNIDAVRQAFERVLTTTYAHAEKGFGDRESYVYDWADWVDAGSIGAEPHVPGAEAFRVAESYKLWEDGSGAEIELTKEFYRLATVDPVVELDKGSMLALQRNVTALEVYMFVNSLATSGRIGSVSLSSSSIARQLGFSCPGFEAKARFIEAVDRVREHWPEIEVESKDGSIDGSIWMPERQGSISIRVGLPHVAQLEANSKPQAKGFNEGEFLARIRRKPLVEQLQTATARDFASED